LSQSRRERSLVAFDVDKTVLHQGIPDELERFKKGICQVLLKLARLNIHLAAVSGNSVSAISKRLLKALLEELCEQRCLHLLTQFHFFCSGAALYLHFSPMSCQDFAALLHRAPTLTSEVLLAEAKRYLFDEECGVRPQFVMSSYARQCSIPEEDAADIITILQEEATGWYEGIRTSGKLLPQIRSEYYVTGTGDAAMDGQLEKEAASDKVNTEAFVWEDMPPEATRRTCLAADGRSYVTACVVMPILSFRHARQRLLLPAQDPRFQLIQRIKERLREAGLVRYMSNAGGRGTIDVNHHLVSKRDAVSWLLKHLGDEGVHQLGEPFGTNCVYFGDEVVLNGNDISVAMIPGIQVYAVNELVQKVPFKTNIELPTAFTTETGPEATKAVLEDLLRFAEASLEQPASRGAGQSAVAAWKYSRLRNRLRRKAGFFLAEDMPDGNDVRVTHRRLEAAAAALTALSRHGEGLDQLAEEIIDLVDNIGAVAMQVRERQFEEVQPIGFFTESL